MRSDCTICMLRQDVSIWLDTSVCRFCLASLSDLRLVSDESIATLATSSPDDSCCVRMNVFSAFLYEGALIDLVHRAKIHGDPKAQNLLVAMLVSRDDLPHYADGCTHVMAAPSSLWSRMRGRHDLGFLLAQAIAAKYHLPLLDAPPSLHWRWSKRARQHKDPRGPGADGTQAVRWRTKENHRNRAWLERNLSNPEDCTLLVVDDIVTTGQTLLGIAAGDPVCRLLNLRGLTLARAGRSLR